MRDRTELFNEQIAQFRVVGENNSIWRPLAGLLRPRPSTLHGPGPNTARANAAAAAEKTEAFRADLMPVPMLIPEANKRRRIPLKSADQLVNNPMRSVTPRTSSAIVATQASVGSRRVGAHGFSCPVYWVKRAKSPQATFDVPNCPQSPKRSATAVKNVTPSARRKKIGTQRRIAPRRSSPNDIVFLLFDDLTCGFSLGRSQMCRRHNVYPRCVRAEGFTIAPSAMQFVRYETGQRRRNEGC